MKFETMMLRSKKVIMNAALAAVALMTLWPSLAHAAWTIQGVDVPRIFGNMTAQAIAIDKTTGHPHIAYGQDHLYHAYHNGTEWVYETVDDSPGVGQCAAIAIDVQGKIHISYWDATNGDLKYATNMLGAWQAITLDSVNPGKYTSIAVDSSNKVHISYYDINTRYVKYATNASGGWIVTTADNTGKAWEISSIAVDSNNKAHISYYFFVDQTNSGLKYATNATGAWVPTIVDVLTWNYGWYTSIAVDSSNKVHISYNFQNDGNLNWGTNGVLKYATNTSGIWDKTTVDSGWCIGQFSSIATDNSNKAHISYYYSDGIIAGVNYATNASGSWDKTTASFSGSSSIAMALDGNNKVHIIYNLGGAVLRYVTNTSGSWVTTWEVDRSGGDVGYYTSIALDSNNRAHISYLDSTNGDLKYATRASGAWVTATVDSTGYVGEYTSIAIDSNNKVHISYHDGTNSDLKYATNASGNWVTTTVDSTGAVGEYTSIAIDGNNKVHISYTYYYDSYPYTYPGLKYATNASGSWAITTVDNVGSVGEYTSIAIDSNNKAHVSYTYSNESAPYYCGVDDEGYSLYCTDSYYGLKYATNAPGYWALTTVGPGGWSYGFATSIALDSSNKVYIVYIGAGLRYVTNASGIWVETNLPGSGTGQYASIAIDSSNKAHISYDDSPNGDLKYLTNTHGTWDTTTVDSAGSVGQYSSITVDSSNKAHISYYDSTHKALKYATSALLDLTPPAGTIKINNNAIYTNTVTVPLNLTCGDLQSTCSQMQFSNDGTSWSAPEAFATTRPAWDITGASGDGLKTVSVKFIDSSGNWSGAFSAAITLDATPPSGTILFNPSVTTTNTPAVTLALTCSDGIGSGCSQMIFSNDNASWSNPESFNTTKTWSLLASDGTKTVYVKYSDVAGNLSSAMTRTITLDTTAPNPPSVSGTSPTINTTPTWTWSSGGGGIGTYRYKLDNNEFTSGATQGAVTSYTPIIALASGSHTLYVQETDAVSNWSSSGSFAIVIDTTPPNAPLVSGAALTSNNKPTWTWHSGGGGGNGTYRYKLDNADLTTGATPTIVSSMTITAALSDGNHTLSVQERDDAGNWSTSGSYLTTVDATLPSGSITISGAPLTNSAMVTLNPTCTDATSGCFQMQFSNDNITWSGLETFAASRSWPLSAGDGLKTVYVKYKDLAGNLSSAITNTITLDTTAPNPPTFSGITTPTNNTKPTWLWSSGGNGGSGAYQWSLDDPTMGTLTGSGTSSSYTPASVLATGQHTLYVQERDAAGNWSLPGSFAIVIDTTAPNVPLVSGASLTSNNKPTWSWASGGGGGNGTYRYKLDNTDLTTGATTTIMTNVTVTTTQADGSHILYVQERDDAGNWSSSGSYATTVDATLPTGSIAITGAPLTNTAIVTLSPTCSDATSGCDKMLFSNSSSGPWSPLAAYSGSASWNLTDAAYGGTSADGVKTVYAKYKDLAGNLMTSSVTGTIILDTIPPTGSVTINGGAQYTISTSITLTVSASDTNSVTQMQFSNDGTTWSSPVSYATTTTWTLAAGADGGRTVFAKFKDTAGNWSTAVISDGITLDTAVATGAVQINGNAASTTTPSVTLTVTCSDATSGCNQMRFSNDNSTWSAPVSFATTTTWLLLASDGTRTVYVQFKDNAGGSWSAPAFNSIFLDSNAPTTTASPSGGNQPNSVGVTLSCSDGTGSGCAATYYTVSSSPTITPTVSSTLYTNGTITLDGSQSPTYLKYFSVDTLGNVESFNTGTYTFVAATTKLSILLSTQTIKQTDTVDVSGSLSEYSTADIDLSGLPITLVVTLNSVPTATYSTYTDSTNGHYLFNNVTGFGLKGTYGITARFNGTGLLQSANSSTQTLLVGNSAGYALIVEGKVPNDEGLLSHNKTANRIYQQLQDRGFAATNIFYYNYNTGQPGVTNSPSKSAIQTALTGTGLHDLSSKMNAVPAPLWVIMVDHGGPEKFYLGNESISPADLNTWLTSFETNLSAPALLEKRVIVIGACYSGSFIPALATAPTETNGGRIVITSAAAGEESYKGPQEPDGVRSGEFFLEEFFKELAKGAAIRSAFQTATDSTRVFTSQGNGSANGVNYYGDSSVQHPLLDDTGDGNGANTLSDGNGDGITAQTQYLGVGLTNSAANPADLVAVTEPVYLDSGTNQAQLWARPDVYDYVDTAWVEVKAPSTQLAATGGTGQLELNIPRIFITPNDAAKQWQYEYGTNCADTEGCFNTPGKYEIYYFTRNMYTEEVSLMKRSIVYRDQADNTPPTTPILLSVPSGTTTKTSVFLEWLASTDSDPLTYTVEIALNSSFTGTSVVYRKEELTSTWQFVGQDANLQDKTTYSWRVIAVDKYGGHAASDPWTFTTNNTNYSLGASISITVKDAASGTLLTGATVTFNSVVARVTDATGKCGLPLGSGQNVTVSASKAGYINSTTYTVTVIDGTDAKQEIRLVNQDPSTYRLTIGKSGTGSGSVLGIPSGITCGATCSATYNANQAITLIATPAIGAYFSGWSNGCIGIGSCTVTLTSATTVTALFFAQTYTVTTNAGTGGAISPSAQVSYNTTTSFTVTPITGYHTTLVTGCSGTLSGITYTIAPAIESCSITALFSLNTYTIVPTAGAGGTITPNTPQTASHNTIAVFNVTPNTGYSASVNGSCGGSLNGTTYSTNAITSGCSVSALFTLNTYTIAATSGGNGTITPASRIVSHNSTTTFTVTPAAGHHTALVTGCSGTLSGGMYTIGAATGNCTISALFSINTYTVTPSAGANGSMSPAAAQTVNYNNATTFGISPNTGYHINTVTGCGGTLNSDVYTTGLITANCTVTSSFTLDQYTVTASAGTGGGISPASRLVSYNATTSFTVTPNTGYHTTLVSGCSGTLSSGVYTTGLITAACIVNATFAPDTFIVTPSVVDGNGMITPNTPQTVNYNGTRSFTLNPNAGYHQGLVSGCSGTLIGNTYTTGPVTADCTMSASFTNSGPSIPILSAPLSGGTVTSRNPVLLVSPSIDPDNDPVTYTYEVYADSGNSIRVAYAAGRGTSWTISPALADNTTYYWRAQATDGTINSAWMTASDFFVSTANDTPTAPGISSPADNSYIGTLAPVLSVTNGADVDKYDILTYDFEVSTDSGFSAIVASITSRGSGTAGVTSWPTVTLIEDTPYYWRSRSKDNHGAASIWTTASFFVNIANNTPGASAPIAPLTGAEVATVTPMLTINNAIDSDRDALTYVFVLATDNTFSTNKQSSDAIVEGAGSTAWTPSALIENTTYYWHARAYDGLAYGPWTATQSIFINTTNEAPGAPTLQNPADISQVTNLSPTLIVNAALDPDNDSLTYEFEVYADSGLSSQVTATSGAGTSWTISPGLTDNTRYWWRTRAKDIHNVTGPWNAAASFFVNNNGTNEPPSMSITAPGAAGEITNAPTYTIRWTAADPDSNPVITLYYDTVSSNCTGTQIATGILMSEPGSYSWDIAALLDGVYYLCAKIQDEQTTVTSQAVGALTINRTTPFVSIGGAPASLTSQSTAVLTISGNGFVTYQFSMDSGGWSDDIACSLPITLSALTDGPHTVAVKGKDSIGNVQSIPTVLVWTVDTQAPDTTLLTWPSQLSHVNSAAFTFSSETNATFECRIDNGTYGSCSGVRSYTELAEGSHSFEVQAIDQAGNTDLTPASYSWIVDTVRTVTPMTGANGTFIPSAPQPVAYGSTTSFMINPTTGYHTTLVTGCSGTLSNGTYITGPITTDCTIAASFAINTYKVTPKALANGAISPATVQTVTYNTKKAFTITPNTGYHLKLVTGCSGTLSGNIYTTGLVTSACTVTASFAINSYTITPKAGAHGAISPSTAQTVTYNSSKAFTITPSAGYRIASLAGCPGSLSGSIYTAGPIVSNCSVSVGFALGSVPPLLQGITPTNDSTPTWTWTTGGAGGIGIYRYQLNGESGVWTVTTTTSYTPATALANGTYTLFVQEIDSAGNWSTSGSSAIRVLLTLAKPAKPQGLTANYAAAVTLTWTDSATNEAGYSIYRKKNSEASFTKLGDISPNLEGYVDTTIITNATYSYYVAAYNGAGATNSDAVTITTGDIHAPDQVIAKVLLAGATVNLTWKDMSATEDKNIIKRMQQGASTWSTIATLGPNITTYNNTGRTARIMYTYTVCATGLGGANECSKDVTVNGPTNLKAAKLITGATLTWTDNADDETGYRIYRRKATETASTQISQGTYTMAYKDSTATNDTTYVYTVEGYTSAGRSSSNEAIVTTGTLTPPTSLTATAIGSQADLTWAHASSTENGYSIWRRKQGDTGWGLIASVGAGNLAYTDSGLTIGSLYSYQVCATTAANGSACSTPAGINNPTNLQAAYTAGIGMALTWTDNSADETSFKVYRRKSTQANMTAIATTSENSTAYTDTTATAAATWYYQVCAANLMNENCGPVVKVVVP